MKKSLIWIAVGAGVIGIGVPAYAAVQSSKPHPTITTVNTTVEDVRGNCDEAQHANDPRCATIAVPVTPTVSVDDNATSNTVDDNATHDTLDDNSTTPNSVDDNATHDSLDDNSATDNSATDNSVDDNATHDSLDDNSATENTVADVSGPCDEAEHAADPSCTGAAAPATSVDDNSGPGMGSGVDDSGHHNGGDDSGHGGNG